MPVKFTTMRYRPANSRLMTLHRFYQEAMTGKIDTSKGDGYLATEATYSDIDIHLLDSLKQFKGATHVLWVEHIENE